MKKIILAIIGWVVIAFMGGSALADPQVSKNTTRLEPEVKVEKKPLSPKKECRVVKSVNTYIEGGNYIAVPGLFVQSCCCGGFGTFIQAVNVQVPITQTTTIKSTDVCE